MTEHTKGPLRVTDAGYIATENEGFLPIITPFTLEAHRDKHRGATDEAMANARRLVACWNACQGIETEALEGGALAAALEYVGEDAESGHNRAADLYSKLYP